MRNFSKTLISMAAGAMAEALTNINYADDTVTFGGVTPGKSQYTLLVVQGTTAEGATEVTYDANESTIKQIDQNDDGTAFTSAVVGALDEGSYKVLVGKNDGTVDSGIFEVSSGPNLSDEPIYIGDVNGDDKVNVSDYSFVLTYAKKRRQEKDATSQNYTANTMDPLYYVVE